MVSPEIFAGVDVSTVKKVKAAVLIRGVGLIAYQVHRAMYLTGGHWRVRGEGQWVIGKKVALRYKSDTGNTVSL